MEYIDKINSLTWLAFKPDLTATEHNSLGDAIKTSPWIIFLELNGKWINNGHYNPAYYAELYDQNGVRMDSFSLDKWVLSNLKISGSYPRINVYFNLTDPWGNSKQNLFGQYRDGLRTALSVLQAASKFSNFTDYIQQDPNSLYEDSLKVKTEEILTLQRENQLLVAEVSKLKQETIV